MGKRRLSSGLSPVGFGVDVLHSNLEAIEAARLRELHLRTEALAEILVDDSVRGSEEGEHVRDEVLLVRRKLLPIHLIMLHRAKEVARKQKLDCGLRFRAESVGRHTRKRPGQKLNEVYR